jgi:sensor histidine kinase YesM
MLIQPVVENAILHGLLPLDHDDGLLKINFTRQQDQVTCVIEDNGVGREKAQEIRAGQHERHTPIGVSVTAERLDLLKKIYQLDAHYVVEDLYDDELAPSGTRVTLIFPSRNHAE